MRTSHGMAMDGFMGAGAAGGNSSAKKVYKITDASNLLNPMAAGTRLKSAAQGMHQRAQRSQTLMRSAVHRPVLGGAVKKPTFDKVKSVAQTTKTAMPKARVARVDSARVLRAQAITKDSKVRRFGFVAESKTAKTAPQAVVAQQTPPQRSTSAFTSKAMAINKPLPSMLTSAGNMQLERMLDEALLKADSHKKALIRSNANLWQKVKLVPRWLSFGMPFFAVLLLTGYLAIHKVPQVAMRLAATKAHVDAHVPGYTPSGFSYAGPIQSSLGSVSIKFVGNGNASRNFTVTQQNSKLDSQALSKNVSSQNTQVQTSTVEGTTVYIYGAGNNATWVNNGMEYKIADSANLNSDQLLKIANSL